MDEISWTKKRISGPYKVAAYVQEMAGGGASGASFSDYYYYGKSKARPETICRFVEAFNCTENEMKDLACAYAFGGGGRARAPRARF